MTVSIASVNGPNYGALVGPTYTLSADTAPESNAKSFIVTAKGGTQTNVRTHSLSDPFSLTVWKPKVPKALPNPNPVTGAYPNVPMNQYAVIVRKGVYIDANSVLRQMTIRALIDVPAGADAADTPNIYAGMSLTSGALYAETGDFGDMVVLGSI